MERWKIQRFFLFLIFISKFANTKIFYYGYTNSC